MKGDLSKLKNLAKAVKDLPKTVKQDVARQAAPDLTGKAQAAFDSGVTVYGDIRPAGEDGLPVSLHKSGKLESGLNFKSVGTIVRAVLAVPYAKYNIRFGILPRGGAKLPVSWSDALEDIVDDTIRSSLAL